MACRDTFESLLDIAGGDTKVTRTTKFTIENILGPEHKCKKEEKEG